MPRTIAENAGHKAEELIASLYAETAKSKTVGIDIEQGAIKEVKVYDSYEVKDWALKLALDTALTILKIDQVAPAPTFVAHHGQTFGRTQAPAHATCRRRR